MQPQSAHSRWAAACLQVAEQRLGLEVEGLRAVVHHLGGGALLVRDIVDVLVEVLQGGARNKSASGPDATRTRRMAGPVALCLLRKMR